MTTDEIARLDLYVALRGALGREAAVTLMTRLRWDNGELATRQELEHSRRWRRWWR